MFHVFLTDQGWGLEVYGSFNTKTYFLVVFGSLCGLLWQHHAASPGSWLRRLCQVAWVVINVVTESRDDG